MPRDRRRGLHVTVGVLLGLMGLPVVLGATWFVRHPRGSLLPILIGNQLAVGIEALCLATVIAIIVPRRRVLALAAAILGVGWVLLSA